MQSQTFVFASRDGNIGGALQRPRLKTNLVRLGMGDAREVDALRQAPGRCFTDHLFLPLVALHRQWLGSDSESLSLASAVLIIAVGYPDLTGHAP